MSQLGRFREFVNRNIVSIVMVPSIVALHWGWLKLQDVEALVSPEEKSKLPLLQGAKVLETKLEQQIESLKKSYGEGGSKS